MKIDKTGAWRGKEAEVHHVYDNQLSNALLGYFIGKGASDIGDFGCGLGSYIKHFSEFNIKTQGYDGNPDTLEITQGWGKTLNFTNPVSAKHEWILSLEVGEHIPMEFESIYIDNLISNSKKGIVLSWATVGQMGVGHVNERNNDYIKNIFEDRGLKNNLQAEKYLRAAAIKHWFKNTIMVFEKQAGHENS